MNLLHVPAFSIPAAAVVAGLAGGGLGALALSRTAWQWLATTLAAGVASALLVMAVILVWFDHGPGFIFMREPVTHMPWGMVSLRVFQWYAAVPSIVVACPLAAVLGMLGQWLKRRKS